MYRSYRHNSLLSRRLNNTKNSLSVIPKSTNATKSTLATYKPETNNQLHSLCKISWNRNFCFQKQSFHSTKSLSAVLKSDESITITALKALTMVSPKNAVSYIEKGWQNGNLPVSDSVLKEYLKAIVKMNRIDSLDIKGLLNFIHSKSSSPSFASDSTITSSTASNYVGSNTNNTGSSVSAYLNKSMPGASPSDPMYMTTVEPSTRSQTWKFMTKIAALFLILSFVGAILDEKTGGTGGISSRLGRSINNRTTEK